MAIQLVPFKAWHVRLMRLRQWDSEHLESSPDLAALSAEMFERNSMGFTAIAPEGLVGAAGAVRLYRTNWELWLYSTPLFEKYGIEIIRKARRILDGFFGSTGVLRVQAPVDSTHKAANRFAQAMGLEHESVLFKYGPKGQDFYMYARVK